jgi:bacteriorhodopsin
LFTTPLLLVSLGILAGLSPYDTLLTIIADVFMIVTGLLSSFVSARWASGEKAKWGFYAVSCIAFLYIWWLLVTGGLKGEC